LELEDVLNEWVASGEGPTRAALAARVRRWPSFAEDLVDFAVAWAVMRTQERAELRQELRAAAGAGDLDRMAEIVSSWRWSTPMITR
jgi:hypothetical protein